MILKLLPSVLLVFGLSATVYEDFRYRQIRIVWFIAVLCAAICSAYQTVGLQIAIKFIGVNASIVVLQLGILWLYFKILKGQVLLDNYLGWGDVVVLFCITPLFSPLNFLLFLVCMFIACLPVSLFLRLLKSKQDYLNIPLAGVLSLGVILLLTAQFVKSDYYLTYNDTLWLNLMSYYVGN